MVDKGKDTRDIQLEVEDNQLEVDNRQLEVDKHQLEVDKHQLVVGTDMDKEQVPQRVQEQGHQFVCLGRCQ